MVGDAVRVRRLLAVLAAAALPLTLAGCASSPAVRSTPAAVAVRASASTGLGTAVERAQVEERCDDLAAKRFVKWKASDPTFVTPAFDAGRGGTVMVTQKVPYTDRTGTPQTSLLVCSGRLQADNTVAATLLILTKHT